MAETSAVEAEYEKAKQEGRQPLCSYCQAPLEIGQTQCDDLVWRWDDEHKRYTPATQDGWAEKPYCRSCETRSWEFVDGNLVS